MTVRVRDESEEHIRDRPGTSWFSSPGKSEGIKSGNHHNPLYEHTSLTKQIPSLLPPKPKPLLLMLPWLGSQPHAIAKYCDIYFRNGFDVLVVESEVSQFLWPRWGLDYGGKLLEILHSEHFASRPLLVHAFSIGGYTFSQLLVHVSKDRQKYQGLTQRIRGHIYDSLVLGSVERMAVGVSKNTFPRWERAVKHLSLLYFQAFKHQTVDYFNAAIEVFRNHPVTAPTLVYYCENDFLCDPKKMEELVEFWRSLGMEVTQKKWADSTHAGHLKRHPEEYMSILNSYLQSLNMVPLRAKM
ncbi:transmembrane protein 53-A [Aplochiton taeniatus]